MMQSNHWNHFSTNDCVDDIHSRRKKDCNQLYHALNNYHSNINLAIEINLKKFLEIKIITKNGEIESAVYRRITKISIPWSSNISRRYKRNTVYANLHRSKLICTIFNVETFWTKIKFLAADYPQKFLESVLKTKSIKDDYILPPGFFDIAKAVIFVEVPFCTKNDVTSKQFIQTFHNFSES